MAAMGQLGAIRRPHAYRQLGVHWTRPELVVEVKYLAWTEDRLLRQVVYEGIREDKPAREVVGQAHVFVNPL
jgi:ATP-dependent DNA ligase